MNLKRTKMTKIFSNSHEWFKTMLKLIKTDYNGPNIFIMLKAKTGPKLDQNWNKTGPKLDRNWT